MPIRRLLNSDPGAFGPDDLTAMTTALSEALRRLGLYDKKDDPLADLVARAIVRAALDGERDPARLVECAVRALDNSAAKAS